MDYEKEYKELVAKLTNAYNDESLNDERFCCVMNGIMPDLAESEEEKVRKDIISLVNKWWKEDGAVEQGFSSQASMIAYLEKKDQKNNYTLPKFTFDDVLAIHCCLETAKLNDKELYEQLRSLHDRVHDAYHLEKQGEQKPAEWSEKYIADVFEMVGLAKIVREEGNDALTGALQSAMIELAKYSVVPQPKQEWSEEDEKHLKGISLCLSSIDNLEDPETWINWFKNLKDRVQSKPKQWKPTEMQLTCLEDAINAYHRDGHPAKCLTSLLNDLKAL